MELILPQYDPIKLLNSIDQVAGFSYYLGFPIEIGEFFSNPLRAETNPDTNPSGILVEFPDKVMMLDKGDGQFNCDLIGLVMKITGQNFQQAVKTITNDSPTFTDASFKRTVSITPKEKTQFDIQFKTYSLEDIKYWESQGINLNTVWCGRVRAARRFRLVTSTNPGHWREYSKSNPIYIYLTAIEGIYKIYRPFADKKEKFLYNGHSNDIRLVFEGWEELPETGELVVICKSRKDRLFLKQRGFITLNIQGEDLIPPEEYVKELQRRFKRVVIFFDRDRTGVRSAYHRWYRPYKVECFFIPKYFKGKDTTGFYKQYGEEITNKIIINKLNEQSN